MAGVVRQRGGRRVVDEASTKQKRQRVGAAGGVRQRGGDASWARVAEGVSEQALRAADWLTGAPYGGEYLVVRRQIAVALVGIWLATATPALAEPITSSSIGMSQLGTPLTLFTLGQSGGRRVLIVGGQHGGPEANTVQLVDGLLDYFSQQPEQLPPGIELDVLDVANPDGLASGSRQFASGVDPNRNWGGRDWRADAYDSNAVFRVGLGGPEPFSEQETRALADWILANKPAFVVNYHSAGGFMFGSREGIAGDLSQAYADASGYTWPAPATPGGARSPLPYTASGSMNVWLREVGVPAILIELSTPRSTDIERNLAGLQAALDVLATR